VRTVQFFEAFIAIALAVAAAARPVAAGPLPDSGSLALRCGALIDGLSVEARSPAVVVIEQGRITAVGSDARVPAGVPVLDLTGYTCLPGLIDMHTHLTMRPEESLDLSENYRRTDEQQASISREHARRTLLAGFTTVRDVGSYTAWADKAIRDEINRGETPGPRMQVAGIYLTIPGGGGDLVIPGHPESEIPARLRMGVARGPEQFRQKAELAVAGGADLLKVIASGAVFAYGAEPGDPEMTPEEIAAVAQVAHSHGLKLVAHAHGARSIREAILAGADTIEHASLIDSETIELVRQHQVALSMDVYNGDYTDTEGRRQGWPEEFLRRNTETTEAQRQGFTAAHAAGVPIVYGTDACIYPHGLNARQFPIMVERGMTPMEAIQSATSVAAKVMGWSDRVGSIALGRFGDVIAVKGDPLQDIRHLQDVAVVVKGGVVVREPGS
jgi:imidazolonepropionase-like amidohydrolase